MVIQYLECSHISGTLHNISILTALNATLTLGLRVETHERVKTMNNAHESYEYALIISLIPQTYISSFITVYDFKHGVLHVISL